MHRTWYVENYTILIKEIKEDFNKWRDTLWSWFGGENSKRTKLQVEPNVTELLQSQKFNRWGAISYGWANKAVSWDRNWSCWRCWEEIIVEIKTKDLDDYINWVDKAAAGFERTWILKVLLLWIKCYQTALHATEKSFVKGSDKLHCCTILRNCHRHPNLYQPPPWTRLSTSKKD